MEVSDLFKFDKFVAPLLIKILYWVGIVLIVLTTIGGIVGLRFLEPFSPEDAVYTLGHALLVLISGALLFLFWRVMCELWLAIFAINDRVGIIAGRDKKEP